MTFDYNHTYYNCTSTAPVLTFEVTEEVSLESELRFDTTVNPVRYSGLIYTQGPEFEGYTILRRRPRYPNAPGKPTRGS